ncbi:unnamed protein product [Xylocopa violacea]|uniref:Cytochrome b-c1 complex subunit 2, mitochondrial n=1 Tax=Xylocopa violacea TaxID=135666 RepID=A0ABP1NKC3_XYLVO
MVNSVVRSSLLRNPTVRHYAVAAAAQSSASSGPETKVLANKVIVAACDTNSPLAQVSIVFRAGSRNETYETQGTAHYLRIAAGLSSSSFSAFAITRNIQQLGGCVLTTLDRESIAYTLQITRNHLTDVLKYFEAAVTKPVFKPWELTDELQRVQYDLTCLSDTTLIVELLHKAAFRNGLGYSLFCPEHQIGSNLSIASAENANEASKYCGGEIRKETNSSLTNVAIAVEGVSLKNEKDALACAVLQRASSGVPRVKWGSSSSPLYKELSSVAGTEPFGAQTFNASYTDSGLFGVVLCSPPNISGSVTKAAKKWLKSLKLSDNDIARGKNILKTEVWDAADNALCLLENMQQQAVLKGEISSPASLVNNIDKLSASDVKAVADKLAKGKLSMASIGNLKTVPYLDELKYMS